MIDCNDIPVLYEADILREQEFNFLNTIDIEEYLKHGEWSVLKIMNEIQKNHGAAYEKESYIFNAIKINDFMRYVNKRYKGKYNFYEYSEIRVEQVK